MGVARNPYEGIRMKTYNGERRHCTIPTWFGRGDDALVRRYCASSVHEVPYAECVRTIKYVR